MHACVFVLINGPLKHSRQNVQQALNRFDEEYPTPPRKVHLSHGTIVEIANQYQLRLDDHQAIARHIPDWLGEQGGVDEMGIYVLMHCNPQAKWDWYTIGGRWDGMLAGQAKRPSSPWQIAANMCHASELLKRPDFDDCLPAAIVTPYGEWIERRAVVSSPVGWHSAEVEQPEWAAKVRRILRAFPRHRIVAVDIHF